MILSEVAPKTNKRDHTEGYQMYRLGKQLDKIDASKNKLHQKWEVYQKNREEKGLFCCRKVDPKTQDHCIRVFSSSLSREKHESQGHSKCSFPPTDLATHMHLLHLDGNLAFCLATGTMTNRCNATDTKGVHIRDGNQMIENKDWFKKGCYNSVRRMNKRATKALLADLEYLFLVGLQRDNIEKSGASKYTPWQALTYLLNLKMPDGRRKYSFDSENQNGPPPSIKYLKSWFSRRARQQELEVVEKKNSSSDNQGTNYSSMTIAKLRKKTRSRFSLGRITKKQLMLVLLATYNDLESIPEYKEQVKEHAAVDDLEKICRKLSLPVDLDKIETYVKLFELQDRVEKMKHAESSSDEENEDFNCNDDNDD